MEFTIEDSTLCVEDLSVGDFFHHPDDISSVWLATDNCSDKMRTCVTIGDMSGNQKTGAVSHIPFALPIVRVEAEGPIRFKRR